MQTNNYTQIKPSGLDWFLLLIQVLAVIGFVLHTIAMFSASPDDELHKLRFLSLGFTLISSTTLGLIAWKMFFEKIPLVSDKSETRSPSHGA
ncbi:hypothetical protein RBE51_19410 [Pseudomonas taiwanensis]|uniref:hypothetical protein n=1 Tax=Pseudomonas taiwanensis TaxID=470150 RepID=UPI0028DF68AB|nr:hypothetical protein [Pseudomonas taiwanensis]MDT8924959.1 hypothetical protein [Pseudomonas taiwanensis]